MICAVGSVFAIPRMTLKVPLSTKMPSLVARSSMGGVAAVANFETPTARPIDAHAMASKEILDGDMSLFLFEPNGDSAHHAADSSWIDRFRGSPVQGRLFLRKQSP